MTTASWSRLTSGEPAAAMASSSFAGVSSLRWMLPRHRSGSSSIFAGNAFAPTRTRAIGYEPVMAKRPPVVVIDHGVHGDVALERTVLEPLGFEVVDTRAQGLGVEEAFGFAVDAGAVA